MRVPPLQTERLIVRPFRKDDLDEIFRILNLELSKAEMGEHGVADFEQRKRWLEWTILGYEQFDLLYQPPYGERAVELKETGELVGAVGYVPCLDVYHVIPSLRISSFPGTQTEFGLFWAISSRHQQQGYATEAAKAMVDYAFQELKLFRLIATTDHANLASIQVMEKLGMKIERNPQSEPVWLQVVGILENRIF